MCTCLVSTLQLHAERSSAPDHTHHQLSWCPYIPQEEGEEEDSWLLAASHGCEVRERKILLSVYASSDTGGVLYCSLSLTHTLSLSLQVEVYNLGVLLSAIRSTGGGSPVVLHRGEEVHGRFLIPSPHTEVGYNFTLLCVCVLLLLLVFHYRITL